MDGLMTALAGAALCHAGLMALCLAMHRHHEQLTGQRTAPSARRWQLRATGAGLLTTALVVCVQGWGGSVGTLLWLGLLSVGALWVASGMAYAPRQSAWLALLVGCLACLLLGWRAMPM